MDVISIHSDSILVVEGESGTVKYEIDDCIKFETKDGFFVKGILSKIEPDRIVLLSDGTYTDYKLSSIKRIGLAAV